MDHSHPDVVLCEDAKTLLAAVREGQDVRWDKVHETATCLLKLGLVSQDPRSDLVRPMPVAAASSRLLAGIVNDISSKHQEIVAIAEAFEPLLAQEAEGVAWAGLEVIRGQQLIQERVNAAHRAATVEVLTIQPDKNRHETAVKNAFAEMRRVAEERGLKSRMLYPQDAAWVLKTKEAQAYLDTHTVQVRVLDELPARTMLFDKTVAFIAPSDDIHSSLEVRHPGVLFYLHRLFDKLWIQADPERDVIARDVGDLSPMEQRVLRQRLAGATSTQSAAALGISTRTEQTHWNAVKTALGAPTDVEVGYKAGLARSAELAAVE